MATPLISFQQGDYTCVMAIARGLETQGSLRSNVVSGGEEGGTLPAT